MEKKIHDTNSYEHPSENRTFGNESNEQQKHDGEKKHTSYDASLDELLDIPTFGDIELIFFFHIARIHIYDVSICRSRACESLTHRMLLEALDTGKHTLEVSLG